MPGRPEGPQGPPRRQGLRPVKRLGQHLLVDLSVIDGILAAAAVTRADVVLEIGPGTGAISAGLARAGKLVAVELDPRYAEMLRKHFQGQERVQILHRDILTITPAELRELLATDPPPRARKCVANIPYYITGPILSLLLNEEAFLERPLTAEVPLFDDILLMVQKEVGERILARPGTRAWGALSVKVQYAAEVEPVLDVPRWAFKPPPQVDSAIVRLRPRREPPVQIANPRLFWRLVEAIFRTRRKTLRNSLKAAGYPVPPQLDDRVRGETFGLAELARLADTIDRMRQP